jgi:tRNA-modifying protein YgfZ
MIPKDVVVHPIFLTSSAHMNTQPTSHPFPTGVCQLTQFALISASGPDATPFLHSQLTNDIKSVIPHHACLAGYCSTKGRLLASLLVWKLNEETLFMEVPAELQESFQKRLQIFVLRSKVKLNHVTESNAVLGILGQATAAQLAKWFPELPAAPYELVNNEAGVLLRLADTQKTARYQWIMSKPFFEQIAPTLNDQFAILPSHMWSLSEIHAGIPHISLATQEKFVPQMINYELIGAVNFKKGCYPGQEIVARTHYLGKQKRRMVLAEIDNARVQSGMEVFTLDDPTQPCGMVVNAEPNNSGGSDCLIEIKTAYLTDAVVQLSSGEICHWLPMPYPLPTDLEN